MYGQKVVLVAENGGRNPRSRGGWVAGPADAGSEALTLHHGG